MQDELAVYEARREALRQLGRRGDANFGITLLGSGPAAGGYPPPCSLPDLIDPPRSVRIMTAAWPDPRTRPALRRG